MKIRSPLEWITPALVAWLVVAVPAGRPAAKPAVPATADVIVTHGKVWTLNAAKPWAEAIAISGEKILAVGPESEIDAYRGSSTKTIDAHGLVVLPGFTDCHIHFLEGALSLNQPDLNDARSTAELRQHLKKYAASHKGNGWVVGQGWSYDAFAGSVLADKTILDAIFKKRPVYLESFDGHTGWVNTRALAKAGITRDTPDPPGGTIVRDPKTKEATGALKEDARHLVKRLVPMPTPEEKLAALRQGLALAAQYGLVRVHAAGEPPDTFGDFFDLDLFNTLRQHGELTLRFYVSRFISPPELNQSEVSSLEAARERYHDEWISVGAAKFFLDGVIESHSAAMLAPYSDDSTTSGSTIWAPESFRQAVLELDRRGFQIFTHAIGDRAVRLALDAYGAAEAANGRRDLRHRIEHIEVVSPEDLPRFASLGVIASMQPLHAYPDPDPSVWGTNVGPERAKLGFAWHSLSDSGAHLAFGSDWEVVTMNPWPGIQTAVTRQTDDGRPAGGWIPEQRIPVAQAIAGYTLGAAYAGHRENMEGSLEPGKLADLIIVSQNPFEVEPLQLGKTSVLLTMVGGRLVYQSNAPAVKIAPTALTGAKPSP